MIVSFPPGTLQTAIWVDLMDPTPDEVAQVKAATGLRVPDRHDVSEIESTSRLAFEGGAYYVSTPVVAVSDDVAHGASAVGFVLSPRVLITVRFAAFPEFDAARALCATRQTQTGEDAFLHLLEAIVDRSADELERAGAQCDELSHRAFRRPAGMGRKIDSALSNALRSVGTIADHSAGIRDALLGLGRISAYVMESGIDGAPTVNVPRLRAIRADVASLTDYESHLAGQIQFLLDATLGFINIEQNEIVKVLTIASVVGIPPVLIAGIYGMNFHNMPELSWTFGYPLSLGLIVVSALIPLAWFKRRGWL